MGDYPTDEELKEIETEKNIERLIDLVCTLWWHGEDYAIWKEGRFRWSLELHTVGWSGNEDIIIALQKNVFWMLFWEKTERGGHYYFKGKNSFWKKEKVL
jgi:hypothetical protein